MLLKRKINASSLAEVVIAISVIALCFGIASLVFVRSTMVTTSFEEVRMQTEIQSAIWEELHDGEIEVEQEGVLVSSETDEHQDSLLVKTYSGLNDKMIWQQHALRIE
jgi:hypothetical protein